MSRFEFLVLTSPVEGREADFNQWYDTLHLPDVLDVPGFVSARRFRIMESRCAPTDLPRWRYAAIYQMEHDDPQAVLADMRARIGTPQMLISDTLDLSTVATYLLEPHPAHPNPA